MNQKDRDTLLKICKKHIENFPRAALTKRFQDYEEHYHLNTVNANPDSEDAEEVGYYRYKELNIGVVKTIAEADHAFYVSTLTSENPMFPVISDEQFSAQASMMNAKMEKDQRVCKWETEVSKILLAASKYNLAVAEVYWSQEEFSKITSDATGKAIEDKTIWAGNKIRYLSPYNVIFDQSVAVENVAADGAFAGHTEYMSQVKLWHYLKELKQVSSDAEVFDSKEMWETIKGNENLFAPIAPQLQNKESTAKKEFDWLTHFDLAEKENKVKYKQEYVVWTFYLRILPEVYGLDVPDASQPAIYKVVVVNGKYVAAAIKMDGIHNNLGIVLACPVIDDLGLDTSSPSGSAISHQKVIKQLVDRAFATLDRAISDRGIYDPEYITADSINSRIPDAKIPLRKNSRAIIDDNNPLDKAYRALPFEGKQDISNLFNVINQMIEYSQFSAGLNRAQTGHFVKGNKTRAEFSQIMSNANSKQFVRALILSVNLFGPIKTIIKSNILQYGQESEQVTDSSANKPIEMDITSLRKAILEFKLLDGLNPKAANISPEFYEFFIRMAEQIPDLNFEFKIPNMVAHMVSIAGGIKMEQYRRTDQEKQQIIQQQQQQAQMAAQGENNAAQ